MNPRPRLLHAITIPFTAIMLRGQLPAMRAAGYDCYLLSSPGPDLESLVDDEETKLVTVPMSRSIQPLADLRSLVRIVAALRRIRPDIVNAGTPKAGLLTLLAARITRVPLRIYTLHGLRLEGERPGSWRYRLLHWSERIAAACAHHVICVSHSLRDKAVAIGAVPAGKAVVLGPGSCNGIDLERFRRRPAVETAALRARLGIPSDRLVVGFVGRIAADKGIDTLVSVFVSLAQRLDVSLLLVGAVEAEDPPSAQTLRVIDERPDIVAIGHLADPAPYYSLMDVFAFPTRREGFGNVVLEAAAAEVPSVTTDATGAVDTVVPGVTGTVVPVDDVTALHHALLELLRSPELRRELGRAAARRAAGDFADHLVWERLEALYAGSRTDTARPRTTGSSSGGAP